jgi:hypothetical protein
VAGWADPTVEVLKTTLDRIPTLFKAALPVGK